MACVPASGCPFGEFLSICFIFLSTSFQIFVQSFLLLRFLFKYLTGMPPNDKLLQAEFLPRMFLIWVLNLMTGMGGGGVKGRSRVMHRIIISFFPNSCPLKKNWNGKKELVCSDVFHLKHTAACKTHKTSGLYLPVNLPFNAQYIKETVCGLLHNFTVQKKKRKRKS